MNVLSSSTGMGGNNHLDCCFTCIRICIYAETAEKRAGKKK